MKRMNNIYSFIWVTFEKKLSNYVSRVKCTDGKKNNRKNEGILIICLYIEFLNFIVTKYSQRKYI